MHAVCKLSIATAYCVYWQTAVMVVYSIRLCYHGMLFVPDKSEIGRLAKRLS